MNGLADTIATLGLALLGLYMLMYCVGSVMAGALDVSFSGESLPKYLALCAAATRCETSSQLQCLGMYDSPQIWIGFKTQMRVLLLCMSV